MTMLARLSTGPCESSASSTPAASSHLAQSFRSSTCSSGNFSTSAGLLRRWRPASSLGLQTGKQLLGAQARDIKARPIAVAVAHGKIDILAREVDVMQRRRHAQIDARMLLGKSAEAIDQPFGGKVRRRADGEDAGALALQQALGADRNAIEGVAQDSEIFAPSLGDDEALALAIEELDPELQFQRLDLVAHGTLRDATAPRPLA